jgi:transcription elongation factor Elf1
MSYGLAIPRDQFYECPHCGRQSWHQCTIYLDHEARKCKTCGHEWIVKFTAYGADFDIQVRKETARLADLVNDIVREFRTGKVTKRKQDAIVSSLLYLRTNLLNFLKEVPGNIDEEEPEELKTISNRSQDYAYMFRREYQGRIYQGVIFCPSQEESKQIARAVRMNYGVTAISKVIQATSEYKERYLIMVPREPKDALEESVLEKAKEYLLSLDRATELASFG